MFDTYNKKLKEAQSELRKLKLTSEYKSDSSEVNDTKRAVTIYKNKAAACCLRLENEAPVEASSSHVADSTSDSSDQLYSSN